VEHEVTERGTAAAACVVVGAGPNLGAAVARRFAEGGHPVALVGRDEARLRADVEAIAGAGHRAVAAVADVARDGDLDRVAEEVRATLGPVGVVIYNAATIRSRRIDEITAAQLTAELEVDAVGAVRAVQAFLPDLRAGGGRIVLSGGGAAIEPRPDYLALSMGKAALRALAFALEEELAGEDVHTALATICGGIRAGTTLAPELLAQRYWELCRQEPDAWQVEHVYR
jgi:short-subunit dehydrogenase